MEVYNTFRIETYADKGRIQRSKHTWKIPFPISEIINTETFKKKLKWLAPLCRILHTFDKLIEKTGLCNILGETLIATAKK